MPRADAAGLVARHDEVSLVLVCAPAGFGKTSLLRSIYESRRDAGERVVWLRLDAADNDSQRFQDYLEAALTDVGGQDSTPRFSLFLDDVEVIRDATVAGLMHDLATSIPAHGTLLLGGRQMPELRIGRLRSQGRVLEIGAAHLRFTRGESEQLLANILGRRLDPELAARLHDRTDGWATALQLAALTLRDRRDHEEYVADFSGTSAELGSYLAEEILATQPEEIRDLLLRASILDSFSAELCDEVLGRVGTAELLVRIKRDNLFLFGLDDRGEWYRLHALFAEFLRRELGRHYPDEIPTLHKRAAEWFVRADKKTSALEHAVLSGDDEYAADMADAFAPALTASGRLSTVIRAVSSLSSEALERRLRLKVHYATCLTGAFQHAGAAPLLEQLHTDEVMASLDAETRGILLFAIPFQMLLQDRFADALAVAEAHADQLDADDALGRAGLTNVRSICLLHLRRFAEIEAIESEQRALATGVTSYALVYAECIAGMSELAQGRLSHATAIFEAALATALSETSASSAPTAGAAACLAEALYEAGRLEGARELLNRHLATITHLAIPDGMIQAHTQHIRLIYVEHGYPEACQAITELKRLGYERDLSRVVATAWAEHSRLALRRNDLAGAGRYLQMAELSAPYTTISDESSASLRARLLTADGRAPEALALLDAELDALDASCRRYALKLRIIRATALRATGRTADALSELARCVEEARHEGFVRVFVDEGAAVAALLRELLAARTSSAECQTFIGALLTRVDEEHGAAEPDLGSAVEALSTRELEVLAHIADGLSNQAIADELIVSLPTVKTHVHSILTKLSAKNRTEAVATARQRQLLAP